MMHVTILGLFESQAEADRAISRLARELETMPQAADAAAASVLPDNLPPGDLSLYREGQRRGGVPVSVRTEEKLVARAVLILAECGAVDLDAREAEWRSEGGSEAPSDTGYTGHDEDIGFATYGGDAVIRPIPQHHIDDSRAGWLGRLEMAAMRDLPGEAARHARCYVARGKTRSA